MDPREDFKAIPRACHIIAKTRGPPYALFYKIPLIFFQHPCINPGKQGYIKAGVLNFSTTDIMGPDHSLLWELSCAFKDV